MVQTGFERFWLNVRFRGQSIVEKYPALTIEQQRDLAAGAFDLWRRGRIEIDYEKNELLNSMGVT